MNTQRLEAIRSVLYEPLKRGALPANAADLAVYCRELDDEIERLTTLRSLDLLALARVRVRLRGVIARLLAWSRGSNWGSHAEVKEALEDEWDRITPRERAKARRLAARLCSRRHPLSEYGT